MTTDSRVAPSLADTLTRQERAERMRTLLITEAERLYARAMGAEGPHARMAMIYEHAIRQALDGNIHFLRHLARLKRTPAPIEEFLDSAEFLGDLQEVWPALRADIHDMNPDVFLGEAPVRQALLGGATGTGKALAVDTPVPTPSGWTTMGELKEGAALFDESGRVCRVVMAHKVLHDRQCYRVRFSDGAEIVADADHLWQTYTKANRSNFSRGRGKPWRVVTTQEIRDTLALRHAIPIAGTITCEDKADLGIDPYVLGFWLGDGSSDSAQVWIGEEDQPETLTNLRRYYTVTRGCERAGALTPYVVRGIKETLRRYGLIKNKHIPRDFLRSSESQRLALLQGLMDSDGTVDKRTGRCIFTNTNERLARDAHELVLSLGWKASFRMFDAKLNGAFVSKGWNVEWTPNRDRSVFRLTRKLAYQGIKAGTKAKSHADWRIIEEVYPVPSVPVRCITVDSPSSLYLAGRSFVPTHNTTLSYSTNAYQMYLLDCFHEPQRLYGLSGITPIIFMFQSVSSAITKRIIYRPFRDLFTAMPYTQKWMDWDKRREGELIFSNRTQAVPALAQTEAILGQAIAGGMLDEVNFMKVIEDSKQAVGARGKGGTYDQAQDVYDNISRRQQRSFQTRGYNMGVLCVLSSTRYKNDFLDRRMDEVKKHDEPGVICLRRKQYEVVPQDRFTGEKFTLLIGTDDYRTQVIEPGMVAGEDYPHGRTEDIPVEYKPRFLSDPDGALRDILGIATDTLAPFLQQRHKIVEAVVRYQESGLKPICKTDFIELSKVGMPQWDDNVLNAMRPAMKRQPRFVHIDLSITGDACGVAVLRQAGFVNRPVHGQPGKVEVVPHCIVEAAVGIKPTKTHEISISEIRRWVMQLQSFYGLNIYKVTYDGFQSVESRQVLQAAGVRTDRVSVDIDMDPYNELKNALYEDRMDMPDFEHLRMEFSHLEYHADKQKVDHPPKSCFTGDTRIRLPDGSTARFDDLAGRDSTEVLTFDGRPVPATGWRPRETMRTKELVEVELDNGEVIRCTPDHRFLLTNGLYKEAQYLTEEDDLQGC